MSGGHWDYSGLKIQESLERISQCETVQERWPYIASFLQSLGTALYQIEHDLDWDICMDSIIKDDGQFQVDYLTKVFDVIYEARKSAILQISVELPQIEECW